MKRPNRLAAFMLLGLSSLFSGCASQFGKEFPSQDDKGTDAHEMAEINAHVERVNLFEQGFPEIQSDQTLLVVRTGERSADTPFGKPFNVQTLYLSSCDENVQQKLMDFVEGAMEQVKVWPLGQHSVFILDMFIPGQKPRTVYSSVLGAQNRSALGNAVREFGRKLELQMHSVERVHVDGETTFPARDGGCFTAQRAEDLGHDYS